VERHELDVVSLLAGLVFLAIGAVGLLQGAGVVENGAPWAVIGAIAAVGVTGIVVSTRRLVAADGPAAEAAEQAEPLDEPEEPVAPAEPPEEEPGNPEEPTHPVPN
jgi:hypothetical protein